MAIAKPLHLVAYVHRPGLPEQKPDLVGHTVLPAEATTGYLSGGEIQLRRTQAGNVELTWGDAVAKMLAKPGRPTEKQFLDGRVRVEVREIVDGRGAARGEGQLSSAALTRFQGQLERSATLTELRDDLRQRFASFGHTLDAMRTGLAETRASVEASFRAQLGAAAAERSPLLARARALFDEHATIFDDAAERARALLDARLAQPNLRAAQVEAAGTQLQALRESCDEARLEAESIAEDVPNLLWAAASIATTRADLAPLAKRHAAHPGAAAIVKHAQSQLDAADARLLERLETGQGDLADAERKAVGQALTALSSPGLAARGRFEVEAVRNKAGVLTHWAVRAVNEGTQPFSATVVMSDAEKNAGIGLESMALPRKGAAAEQHLIAKADYGVPAEVGERVRLGVRSYGWTEFPLPKSGTVTVDVRDLTIENNGADRPEDFSAEHLAAKRKEKFATGKVRFFQGGRPWSPADE